MVTAVPEVPVTTLNFVIVGAGTTMNDVGEVPLPPIVETTTGPVITPAGTTQVSVIVSIMFTFVACIPANVTVVPPTTVRKFVPVIVTTVPAAPPTGAMAPTVGGANEFTFGAGQIDRQVEEIGG